MTNGLPVMDENGKRELLEWARQTQNKYGLSQSSRASSMFPPSLPQVPYQPAASIGFSSHAASTATSQNLSYSAHSAEIPRGVPPPAYSLWPSQIVAPTSGRTSIPGTGFFPVVTPSAMPPPGATLSVRTPSLRASIYSQGGSEATSSRVVQQQIHEARSQDSSLSSAGRPHTASSVPMNAYLEAVTSGYLPVTWHSTLGSFPDRRNPISIWQVTDYSDRRTWVIITPQNGNGTWFDIVTGESSGGARAIWTVQLASTCTHRRDVSGWPPPWDREEYWPKSYFGNSVSGQTTMRGKLVSMIDALRQKLGLSPLRRG